MSRWRLLLTVVLGIAVSRCDNDPPGPQIQPQPPGSPSALAAVAVGSAQINLTWLDNASNEDGFRIERCAGPGCSAFAEIGTAGVNAASYQDAGLNAGTTYTYRVRAYNAVGMSPYSSAQSATTQGTTLAAPSALTATPYSAGQINLTWADNSNGELGFHIERCSGTGCATFAEITTVGQNASSYNDVGLTPGTTYRYRIRAYNAAGSSDYTAPATAATPPITPLAAPSNLTASPAAGRIDLSWSDNSAGETGFRIERCAGASCGNFAEITTVGANVATYQNAGLTASTSYSYRVRAYNGTGQSTYSNTASAVTPADGYALVLAISPSTPYIAGTATKSPNQTSYAPGTVVTISAAAGAGYRFRDWTGSVTSPAASVTVTMDGNKTVTANFALKPPVLASPSVSGQAVNLSWSYEWPCGSPCLASSQDGYEIEESSTSATSGFARIATLSRQDPLSLSLTRASGTYYYRVRALTRDGFTGYSEVRSATVQATQPRRIRIINSGPTTVSLKDVVRLKLAANVSGFGDADLLSDDRFTSCQDISDISYVSPATSMTFDQPIGANYSVWLSMGVWQTDFFSCSTIPWVWTRRTSFQTSLSGPLYYVYAVVNVTGHASGTLDFTISGSYLNGTLQVRVSQNGTVWGTVPFTVSQ